MIDDVYDHDGRSNTWGGNCYGEGPHLGWDIMIPIENGALISVLYDYPNGDIRRAPELGIYLHMPYWTQDHNGDMDQLWAFTAPGGLIIPAAGADVFLHALHGPLSIWHGCEPEWAVVIVDLPTGQASWHVAPDDMDLFTGVPRSEINTWDGHSTEEKYARLARLGR